MEKTTMNEPVVRPYAGQAWKIGLFTGQIGLAGLQILAKDLRDDAHDHNVTPGDGIELWINEEEESKGLFVGDTTSLPDKGWTKLATL
jgi:hypothetical protein